MVVLSKPWFTSRDEKGPQFVGPTLVFSTRRAADSIEGNAPESPGATWFVAVVDANFICNLVDQEIAAGGGPNVTRTSQSIPNLWKKTATHTRDRLRYTQKHIGSAASWHPSHGFRVRV